MSKISLQDHQKILVKASSFFLSFDLPIHYLQHRSLLTNIEWTIFNCFNQIYTHNYCLFAILLRYQKRKISLAYHAEFCQAFPLLRSKRTSLYLVFVLWTVLYAFCTFNNWFLFYRLKWSPLMVLQLLCWVKPIIQLLWEVMEHTIVNVISKF